MPPIKKFQSYSGPDKQSWREKDKGKSDNWTSDKRGNLRERLREGNDDFDNKANKSDKRQHQYNDSAHQKLNDELAKHVGKSKTD